MSGFSNDGQWWWEGGHWIATSQVVLPQLPMTEFERSGKLSNARSRMRKQKWLGDANIVEGLSVGGSRLSPLISIPLAVPYLLTSIGYLVVQQRAFRDYRLWTLEQLALATSFLLGPDEAMLAG